MELAWPCLSGCQKQPQALANLFPRDPAGLMVRSGWSLSLLKHFHPKSSPLRARKPGHCKRHEKKMTKEGERLKKEDTIEGFREHRVSQGLCDCSSPKEAHDGGWVRIPLDSMSMMNSCHIIVVSIKAQRGSICASRFQKCWLQMYFPALLMLRAKSG